MNGSIILRRQSQDFLTENPCFSFKLETAITHTARENFKSLPICMQHCLTMINSSFKLDQTTNGMRTQLSNKDVHFGTQQLTRGSQMPSVSFCIIQSSCTIASHTQSSGVIEKLVVTIFSSSRCHQCKECSFHHLLDIGCVHGSPDQSYSKQGKKKLLLCIDFPVLSSPGVNIMFYKWPFFP